MRAHTFALLLLTVSACGFGDKGDSAEGSAEGEAPRDPYPLCETYNGGHFFLAQWQVLYDPIDFDGESWDWDGDGIVDFYETYEEAIDLLMEIYGAGAYTEVVDLLLPYAEDAAEIMLSPYVSPDPYSEIYYWDGSEDIFQLDANFAEDQNLAAWEPLEVTTSTAYDGFIFDYFDEDLALDDYTGSVAIDRAGLRSFADCGPFVYVFTDREMDERGDRLRAIAFEIESW